MDKRGQTSPASGSSVVFLGVILLLIALNISFDWFAFEVFGFIDISLFIVIILAVILSFVGLFKKQNVTILLGFLLMLIALNTGLGWFAYTFWKLDVASISLIVLGIAFLYYGFMKKRYNNSVNA